jgi:plastocyanin
MSPKTAGYLAWLFLAGCDCETGIESKIPIQAGPKGATLKGRVKLKGTAPEAKTVQIPQVYQKMCGCERMAAGDLQVGKENGVRWVYVEAPGKEATFAPESAKVVQKSGVYHPRVLVVGPQTSVSFENADSEIHNVHLATDDLMQSEFNVVTRAGESHEAKVGRTGRFRLICDIHSWMRAWLIVTENPRHAVTDEEGRFAIADLAPGEHEVRVWHETLGEKKVTVVVKEGGGDEVVIEMEGK